MSKEKLFFVGVKALITDDRGQVLLLDTGDYHQKHQERHWDFPGGRIDIGEDPQRALERELLEETGIKDYTEPHFFTASISKHQIKLNDGTFAGLVLLVYKTSIGKGSDIVLSNEHIAYKWATRKEAVRLLENKYPAEFTELISK